MRSEDRLAAEYSLKPSFSAPFSDIFADESDDPLFAQLLTRMRVVDKEGNAEMDEDQLEAASKFFRISLDVSSQVWSESFGALTIELLDSVVPWLRTGQSVKYKRPTRTHTSSPALSTHVPFFCQTVPSRTNLSST